LNVALHCDLGLNKMCNDNVLAEHYQYPLSGFVSYSMISFLMYIYLN